MGPVLIVRRRLLSIVLALTSVPLGCHGQAVAPGASTPLSPSLARRAEVLIRSRGGLPPNYTISMSPLTHSDVPGFNQFTVLFHGPDGQTGRPVAFLLSDDGKTLGQFSKYDISADPKAAIPDGGRPGRGGPESAPVTIVGFDDLECPFCARLHADIFPALLERYGDKVHFVYKDYPLPMHPWAIRAAIDVNCLAAQSVPGYWNEVDHIHAHAGELGGAEKSLETANHALDTITLDEGRKQHVDEAKLKSCVDKQDDAAVRASMKEGEALGLNSTPVLYVNGEKFEGAFPSADLFRMIDGALLAQGVTPPPPVPAEKPAAPPATAGTGNK